MLPFSVSSPNNIDCTFAIAESKIDDSTYAFNCMNRVIPV